MEGGGNVEFRIHMGRGTRSVDLIGKPRVLTKMKNKKEKFERH
jgi:hypothetical protein